MIQERTSPAATPVDLCQKPGPEDSKTVFSSIWVTAKLPAGSERRIRLNPGSCSTSRLLPMTPHPEQPTNCGTCPWRRINSSVSSICGRHSCVTKKNPSDAFVPISWRRSCATLVTASSEYCPTKILDAALGVIRDNLRDDC